MLTSVHLFLIHVSVFNTSVAVRNELGWPNIESPSWSERQIDYTGIDPLICPQCDQPFVWECHDCHAGVVIPDSYKNTHGEIVKIDVKNLGPSTKVVRF